MRDAILLVIGMLLAMTFGFAFPKTYDEKKWELLQQKKEVRRANERQYQSCANACLASCGESR